MKTPDTTPRTEIGDEIEKLSSEYADRHTLKQGHYDDNYGDRLSMRHAAFSAGARHYAEKLAERDARIAGLNRYIESRELGSSSPETALLAAYRERDSWRRLAEDAQNWAEDRLDDEWLDRLKALREEK